MTPVDSLPVTAPSHNFLPLAVGSPTRTPTSLPGDWSYNKGGYKLLHVVAGSGKVSDITDFLITLKYTFDENTANATFTIVLQNAVELSELLNAGDWFVLYGPLWDISSPSVKVNNNPISGGSLPIGLSNLFTEIDRGQITTITNDVGDTTTIQVVAKDPAWILAKDKIPYRLPSGTLTQRLRFLQGRGIIDLVEPLIETVTVLNPTRGGIETVWKDIMYDLGETNTSEGTRYVLRQRQGQFYIQEITKQSNLWAFELGNNIFSMKHTSSIEGLYNKIYVITTQTSASTVLTVVGNNPTDVQLQITGFSQDEESIAKYGQHWYVTSKELEPVILPDGQAQSAYLLKKFGKVQETAVIHSYALFGIRTGDQIVVSVPQKKFSGIYYVRAAEYNIANGEATMMLTVDILAVIPDQVRTAIKKGTDVLAKAFGLGSGANGVPFGTVTLPPDVVATP